MSKHVLYDGNCEGCEYTCRPGTCILADIRKCKVCQGEYGSLTTDCPGHPLADKTLSEIFGGRLDYREDQGWVREYSPYQKTRILDQTRRVLYGKMNRSAVLKNFPLLMEDEYDQIELDLEADLVKKFGFVRNVV